MYVIGSHIYAASHLRVWQTPLHSALISMIFYTKSTRNAVSHVLSLKSYICLSQINWNVKSRTKSQSNLKENARTITMHGLTLPTITTAENSINVNY